jgi:uncharacterized membrane protein (UPF0127 family)
MHKIIEVEGVQYKVEIADTPELREKGLQDVESLGDHEGMLFIFEEPTEVGFWMKDTLIPLDIIFINEDEEVVEVHHGEPHDEDTVFEAQNIKYVLEVNIGSGIEVGDDVDLEDIASDESKLLVVGPEGDTQMELKGGERIFSRPNTKTLVKLAKRAYDSEDESDYKRLGKKVFKYLEIQNNKESDYVEVPDTSE